MIIQPKSNIPEGLSESLFELAIRFGQRSVENDNGESTVARMDSSKRLNEQELVKEAGPKRLEERGVQENGGHPVLPYYPGMYSLLMTLDNSGPDPMLKCSMSYNLFKVPHRYKDLSKK